MKEQTLEEYQKEKAKLKEYFIGRVIKDIDFDHSGLGTYNANFDITSITFDDGEVMELSGSCSTAFIEDCVFLKNLMEQPDK